MGQTDGSLGDEEKPVLGGAERRFPQRDCVAGGSAAGKRPAPSGTEGRPVGRLGQRRQRQGSRTAGSGRGPAERVEVFSPGTLSSCEAQVEIFATF